MEELIKNVWNWFDEKGLNDPVMQMVKVQEEIGELAHEVSRNRYDSNEIKDALGDSFVTLIGMCHHLNYQPKDVLQLAYDEIKDRTGEVVNGSFVKDEEQDTAVELFDFFKDLKGIELESGYIIAEKDYTQAGKNEFTWDEAMDLNEKVFKPNGWHLPTCKEWAEICLSYMNDNGDYDRDKLAKELNLGEDEDGYGGGDYWSASVYSEYLARGLGFYTTGVYPRDYNNKGYGFSVRLVKNKE